MGIRDMFKSKPEPQPGLRSSRSADSSTNNAGTPMQSTGSEDRHATENNDRVRPAARPTTVTTVSSLVSAKQRLAAVAQDYNTSREVLQRLLFTQQEAIQQQVTDLSAKLATAQETSATVSKDLNHLQDEAEAEGEAAMSDLKQQQDALDADVNTQQGQIGSVLANVNELGHELKVLQQRKEKLQADEAAISEAFKSETDPMKIVALADKYRQEIDDNQQQLDKTTQMTTEVETKRDQVKAQLKQLRSQLMGTQKQQQAIDDQRETLQEQAATANEARNQQIETLSQQLTEAEEKAAQLQRELGEQTDKLSQINADIQDWLSVPVPVNGLMMDTDTEVIFDMDSFTTDQLSVVKQAAQLLLRRGVKQLGLFTATFAIDLSEQLAKWADALGIDSDRLKIHSPLYDLQHEGDLSAKVSLPSDPVDDVWNDDRSVRTLTLADQWEVKVRYYNDDATNIAYIGYYKAGQLTEESTVNSAGVLAANRFYQEDGKLDRDEYYRQNGLGVLTVHYSDNKLSQIEVLNPAGMQVQAFGNLADFNQWWLANEFQSTGLLVGAIENDDYRQLAGLVQGSVAGVVTQTAVAADQLVAWSDAFSEQQYFAENYETELKLVERLNRSVNVSLIDQRNMPVTMGVIQSAE